MYKKTKPCLIFLKPTWIVECALLEEMDGIMRPGRIYFLRDDSQLSSLEMAATFAPFLLSPPFALYLLSPPYGPYLLSPPIGHYLLSPPFTAIVLSVI